MFLLLFLIAAASAAATVPRTVLDGNMVNLQSCRIIPRDDLLDCFSTLVDTNHDNILNSTEITTFLTAQNIPAQTVLMRICDTNSDGALDATDWNSPNACAHSQPIITRACYICVNAGWTPPSMKKKSQL